MKLKAKTNPLTVQIFFNLQNYPLFHSEELMVNLVRGRECFVGLSILLSRVYTRLLCEAAAECHQLPGLCSPVSDHASPAGLPHRQQPRHAGRSANIDNKFLFHYITVNLPGCVRVLLTSFCNEIKIKSI